MRHKPSILEHCDWADEIDMGIGLEQPTRVDTNQLENESVDLLRLALAVGDLGLWQWDHAKDEVTLDDRAGAILGGAPIGVGLPLAALRAAAHPGDLRDSIEPEMAAYASGRKPIYELEFRTRSAEGDWLWVLLKGCPVERDADLKPRRTAGTITNITARKRREEEQCVLAETAQRLDLVLRASRQGIWDWDVTAGAYTTNETYFTMLGYPPATGPFPVETFGAIIHPDDRERVWALVGRAHRDAAVEYRTDLRLRCAGGEYRWVQTWGQVVSRGEAGEPLRMMGVHLDVDDYRRENYERRRLQSVLQCAVDAMPQSVWWKDLEGRFLGANRALAVDAGLPGPEALVGRCDAEMPWHDQASQIQADDRAVALSGIERLNLVEKIRTASGGERWVRTNKIPLRDEDGEVIGTLGTFEDVTTEHNIQAELRAARDAAESANRAKSEFLARMSHEIRTPMNGILGMTQLALDTQVDAFQRDCLETAHASGEALLTIINDILDFSKVEAGQLTLSPISFSLRQLVNRVMTLLDFRASEKGLQLSTVIAPEIPGFLQGDEIRLGQVLTNLVGNAVKFTPAGGAVTLRISLEPADQEPGLTLRCEVADTGRGIAAEHQQHIFEPFRQADDSTTRHFGGTGLGLAICRQLVELMHGRIWVESELGAGSRFFFTCRLGLALESATVPPPPAATVSAPACILRVLLVEDHPVNLKLARHLLEREGCAVTAAGNGMEALRLVCAQLLTPYDLILMDCQMPVMNGWDATRAIRDYEARHGLEPTPIVALTANAMDGDRERCIEAGMDDYLSKPIDRAQLTARLQRHRT